MKLFESLRDAVAMERDYLFSSPIAIVLWILAILGFVAPIFMRRVIRKPQAITD